MGTCLAREKGDFCCLSTFWQSQRAEKTHESSNDCCFWAKNLHFQAKHVQIWGLNRIGFELGLFFRRPKV